MRNVKTREGFEYWDKICSLKHYGFLHSPDGKRVVKTEGIGNRIDKFEAQEIVDQAQDEINQYRAERDALQQRLTASDELADVLEAEVARLNRVKLALKELAESYAGNLSVYRHHLREVLTLAEKVRDASLGMKKKCLADMVDYLHQTGAALKPAEGGGDA